jgi:hypothetical protein
MFSDHGLGISQHCVGNVIKNVQVFTQHVLLCIEYANDLSSACRIDLLGAVPNRANDIEQLGITEAGDSARLRVDRTREMANLDFTLAFLEVIDRML